MKFELTRAQLTPAKFIARDGKCVFHGYLQVTIAPLSPSLACIRKSREFPFKLAVCYSNPYHVNCFWLKNIRRKFFFHDKSDQEIRDRKKDFLRKPRLRLIWHNE